MVQCECLLEVIGISKPEAEVNEMLISRNLELSE